MISSSSSEGLDEEIASVLPALTSVKPRKTLVAYNNSATYPITLNHIEATPLKNSEVNSFDKILEHQYKIKGLDKDYEDETTEAEDEKLIGVMGSQVIFKLIF